MMEEYSSIHDDSNVDNPQAYHKISHDSSRAMEEVESYNQAINAKDSVYSISTESGKILTSDPLGAHKVDDFIKQKDDLK